MPRIVRTYRCNMMRQGDIFLSRSNRVKGKVIRYASCWGKGREGRRRARRAVKDERVPNHGGNIHDRHGQKYPVEATAVGYKENNLDDYRVRRNRIIRMFRWRGFDNPDTRKLSGQVLELWCRRGKRVRYDWWGAFTSSPLGRLVFFWKKNDPNRLFCTEGVVYLLVICGFLGIVYPYNVKLSVIKKVVDIHPDQLPATANPVDLLMWMERHPDFSELRGFLV